MFCNSVVTLPVGKNLFFLFRYLEFDGRIECSEVTVNEKVVDNNEKFGETFPAMLNFIIEDEHVLCFRCLPES